jgi:uncharacterized membrane protein
MQRFWEIDFLRGVALVFMVIFNYSFALKYFGIVSFESWHYWWLFPRLIASAFILLAGISLWISWSRNPSGKRLAKRGTKIFLYGFIITAVTWLLYPEYAILFGILHLIGISIILSVPFLKNNRLLLPVSAILILAGFYLNSLALEFSPVFFAIPQAFQTFDYFPLLPWFGMMLLGVLIGIRIHGKLKISKQPAFAGIFSYLGRHSLLIYFLHQPALLVMLHLMGYVIF